MYQRWHRRKVSLLMVALVAAGLGVPPAAKAQAAPPDLALTKSHQGNFFVGSNGTYVLRVANGGAGPTTGTITLTDTLPFGLGFVSGAGTGWTCSAAGPAVTCTHSAVLAASAATTVTLIVSVSRAAVPGVTNVAAVSTAGDTNATNNSASDPTTVEEYYTYEVLAAAGQTPINGSSPLTGIDSNVSINDDGTVAMVGLFSGGQGILVNDGATGLRSINPGLFRSSVSFAPAVQINNNGKVVGRQLVAGIAGVPPRTFIRSWDASTTDSFVTVASGGGSSDPFGNVFSFPAISNQPGQHVAFSGQEFGSNVLATSNVAGLYDSTPLAIPLRPMLDDGDRVVVRAGNLVTSPIRLYNSDLLGFETIASPASGFATLGNRPGISDLGGVVGFAGDRGNGDGVFLSIPDATGGRNVVRAAGESWDGTACRDPQLGLDAAANPVCFRSIDRDTRMAVVRIPDGSPGLTGDTLVVSFIATPSGNGPTTPRGLSAAKGVWTVRIDIPISGGSPAVEMPQSGMQIGETILGHTIADLGVNDQIAQNTPTSGDAHRLAFWASSSTGDIAVRASHSPIQRRLIFQQQPSPKSGMAKPFPQRPVVAVVDGSGQVVASDNTTVVQLSPSLSSPGGGVLTCSGGSGPNAQQMTAGVATFAGCRLSLPGTYSLVASSILGDVESEQIEVLCGGDTIARPGPGAPSGGGWSLTVDVTDNDGVVVSDVFLGTRYMAREMRLPYYVLETERFAGPGSPSAFRKRLELEPDSTSPEGRSRLIDYSVTTGMDLVVQATYAIDRIPADSASCLLITQRYEFLGPIDPATGVPRPRCEPSGTINCRRFRPQVSYEFLGQPGESLKSINVPQRLYFAVDQVTATPNRAAVIRDCDPLEVLPTPNPFFNPECVGYAPPVGVQKPGFADRKNPVEKEMIGRAIVAGGKGDWDNVHQTPLASVRLPFPGLIGGCPECVHIHWRWTTLATLPPPLGDPTFATGTGVPLIPGGSAQSVEFGLVRVNAGGAAGERDPADWTALVADDQDLNAGPIAFWYSATGVQSADQFFTHYGFFSPDPSLDINTPVGNNIVVKPKDGTTGGMPITLTFDSVVQPGETGVGTTDQGPPPLAGFRLGSPPVSYLIESSAIFSGKISVCIDFSGVSFSDPTQLRLMHYEDGRWRDSTVSIDLPNTTVCGEVTSLSPFALMEPASGPPTANPDPYATDEDVVLTVPAPGVLANDTDPDPGDTRTAVLVTGPANGTLVLRADGSFTYTPNANYSGTDTFTYQAKDAAGALSNVATVTITVRAVNDPPVAAPDSYTTDEDVVLTVPAPGVLANDTDPDPGDTRTAVLTASPANGTVVLNAYGSFAYTPNPHYSGTDGFRYQAKDAAGALSLETTVTITVRAVNRPPVCTAVREDRSQLWPPDHTMRLVTLSGASDPDGDPVRITIVGVTQDEPVNGQGDGDTAPDAQGVATTNQVFLRAERSGRGDGRVYRVSFTVTDGVGGYCVGVVKVGVPKSQGGPGAIPIESPLVVNSFGS